MGYTKRQIEILGARPRVRKKDKKGNYQLTPVEKREVSVMKKLLKQEEELWQFWRLIPYEDGYACQRRKEFEEFIDNQIENMWWDIGIPEFNDPDDPDSWFCRDGWWPYMRTHFIDVCSVDVGNVIIDYDEVFTTTRNCIEEIVWGYRMSPGMKLYRVVNEWLCLDRKIADQKATKNDKARYNDLKNEMSALANLLPTKFTKDAPDREYYSVKYHPYNGGMLSWLPKN